uniref:RING-type domain-containing protein n=1 Tax=Caenorhabditis tropicalis TaxID=1561998 RepID=A0A1I7TZN5_9PELO
MAESVPVLMQIEIEKCIVCDECFSFSKIPLLLPCHHNVCCPCAKLFFQTSPISPHYTTLIDCPFCQKKNEGTRTREAPFGFPQNLRIVNDINKNRDNEHNYETEMVKFQKTKCRDCQEELIVYKCLRCSCSANEEEVEEKDVLGRDLDKLFCAPCIMKSHQLHEHEFTTVVEDNFEQEKALRNRNYAAERYKSQIEPLYAIMQGLSDEMYKLINMIKQVQEDMAKDENNEYLMKREKTLSEELDKVQKSYDKLRAGNVEGRTVYEEGPSKENGEKDGQHGHVSGEASTSTADLDPDLQQLINLSALNKAIPFFSVNQ